jgi:glycerol-3-phosphate cytidylyltransferase-like family protein
LIGKDGLFSIGVNHDDFVKKYKGRYPVLNVDERVKTIASLNLMASVFTVRDGNDILPYISYASCATKLLAIGSDWAKKDYLKQIGVTQEQLDDRGIKLIYLPYSYEISSTMIKERTLLHCAGLNPDATKDY